MLGLLKNIDKYIFSIILILFIPFRWFSRKSANNNTPNNIVFVKIWAVGDSVNSLPLINETKKRYPKSRISVIAKDNAQVYKNLDFVDEIISGGMLNLLFKFQKYDLAFDLEPFVNASAIMSRYISRYTIGFSGQFRSVLYDDVVKFENNKHIVQTYISMGRHIGISQAPNKLVELRYSKGVEKKVNKILSEKGASSNNRLIGICASVGSTIKEREWPKERFKELARRLTGKSNTKIILIGTKSDYELNEFIKINDNMLNLSGLLSLEELFCMMKRFDVFISNDTGPMHIAAAQGIKTIGLFGPNTPKIWAPYGKGNISIFHPKKGCPYLDNTSHNLVPDHLTREQLTCMDAITVDEVMSAVSRSR
jgi:heptosyltransferase II